MTNAFLERVRRDETTLLLGIRSSRTSDVVRIAASAGYHGILVDLEHATMDLDVAAALCATATDLGMTPFVRVPEREYGAIGRLLDCGAGGIIAPRIDTADAARTVVEACRFPPRGRRSQLAMVPQLGMRPTPATILNPALDAATIVQVILETPEGIAQADAIAALDGVDIIAIGANDLTAEVGVPGQYGHPLVRGAVSAAATACRLHNKLLMLGGVSDLETLRELMPLGVSSLLLVGMDTDLLYAGAAARAELFTNWHRTTSEVRPHERPTDG